MPASSLAPLFAAVGEALRQRQSELNAADPFNANHGDHMVQVFEAAAQAAASVVHADPARLDPGSLADQMENAAHRLRALADNGSAQSYAVGLGQMAHQFRRYNVSLDDLLAYIGKVVSDQPPADRLTGSDPAAPARSGDVLKALLAGLAGWSESENGRPVKDSPLDMGALFELGMAYMQAKTRGGSRLEVLADAAASASPLARLPHRYISGKLAIQTLLVAMQAGANF